MIVGNWKMNKTAAEAVTFVKALKKKVKSKVVICAPFTCLDAVSKEAKGSLVKVGAQNIASEESGAFTGEISAAMIKEFCDYVILGHSERRQHFSEKDAIINKKLKLALAHKLIPILCVGETLAERERGNTKSVVSRQLSGALEGIKDTSKLVIAYEPVWAIGTGKNATAAQAQEAHAFIRTLIHDDAIPILYGGSVKSSNAAELLSQKDVDGALVGGASLDINEFMEIVKHG